MHVFHFCLKGYGVLQGITEKQGQLWANLQVLLLPDSQENTSGLASQLPWIKSILEDFVVQGGVNQEEVFLKCQIDDRVQHILVKDLEAQRLAGHAILIGFNAGYHQFGFHQAGQTAEDPREMVHLHGKLISLNGWFNDGQWVNTADYLLERHQNGTAL